MTASKHPYIAKQMLSWRDLCHLSFLLVPHHNRPPRRDDNRLWLGGVVFHAWPQNEPGGGLFRQDELTRIVWLSNWGWSSSDGQPPVCTEEVVAEPMPHGGWRVTYYGGFEGHAEFLAALVKVQAAFHPHLALVNCIQDTIAEMGRQPAVQGTDVQYWGRYILQIGSNISKLPHHVERVLKEVFKRFPKYLLETAIERMRESILPKFESVSA
jgi:hypothetical protein